MKKTLTSVLVAAAASLALSACEMPEEPTDSGSGSSEAKTNFTPAQEQSISAAKNYLAVGIGYSRFGLIQQLTSKAGNGFKRADAVFAIKQLKPNWNRQAVLAAKNYMESGIGYSRDGLIQQLTSRAGNGFTRAQAEQAADKVGL